MAASHASRMHDRQVRTAALIMAMCEEAGVSRSPSQVRSDLAGLLGHACSQATVKRLLDVLERRSAVERNRRAAVAQLDRQAWEAEVQAAGSDGPLSRPTPPAVRRARRPGPASRPPPDPSRSGAGRSRSLAGVEMACPNPLCPDSGLRARYPLHPVVTWTCRSCSSPLVVFLTGAAHEQHASQPVVRTHVLAR